MTMHCALASVYVQAPELSAERKADQAAVDAALKPDAMMKKYLKAKFSLSKGDVPHKMKF